MVIAGADHPSPGSSERLATVSGKPSQALDATAAAWAFFKRVAGK